MIFKVGDLVACKKNYKGVFKSTRVFYYPFNDDFKIN